MWVYNRAFIQQNTIVAASTVAPLSRLAAKRQNADWPTVRILFLYSFLEVGVVLVGIWGVVGGVVHAEHKKLLSPRLSRIIH